MATARGAPSAARLNVGDVSPCPDTSAQVFQQLVPPQLQPAERGAEGAQQTNVILPVGTWIQGPNRADLSPRTFENRLRRSAPIFHDLQQVSAVSPVWAQRANIQGWPAAHAYLYQGPGTKAELRERYSVSKRQLVVTEWIRAYSNTFNVQQNGADVVSRIAAFMP